MGHPCNPTFTTKKVSPTHFPLKHTETVALGYPLHLRTNLTFVRPTSPKKIKISPNSPQSYFLFFLNTLVKLPRSHVQPVSPYPPLQVGTNPFPTQTYGTNALGSSRQKHVPKTKNKKIIHSDPSPTFNIRLFSLLTLLTFPAKIRQGSIFK